MTVIGLVLMVLGAVVAVAEAHFPSHGIAGGLGVVAMAVGVVLALSGLGAGLALGLLTGGVLAGAGGGGLALVVRRGALVRHQRVRTGTEGLVGHVGVVQNWTQGSGRVALDGALWRARRSAADEPEEIRAGDAVVVERLSGLTLSVRRAEEWELL